MPPEAEPETRKYLFLLSAENIEMAKAEILAVSDIDDYEFDDRVFVTDCKIAYKRLALTRRVYQFLFSCARKDLEKEMKAFDWSSIYKENFCLRLHRSNVEVKKSDKTEKDLAEHIWNGVKIPKVELKQPVTRIDIILTDDKAYCGKVRYESKESFSKRRSHLRPYNQPTSMNPKIARACVNLSGIKVGDTMVDPFCGAGGIMLEAGLMRFATRGYDIDKAILGKCERNLDYYKVKRFKLIHLDALKISEMADYVVTDIPYGMGSAITDEREKLYADFLEVLWQILKNKAVVIFPDSVDHKKLIKKTKFTIENEFSVYVHKALTRNIVLLKKK